MAKRKKKANLSLKGTILLQEVNTISIFLLEKQDTGAPTDVEITSDAKKVIKVHIFIP